MYWLSCHYDLNNLAEHRCPECGRAFDPKDSSSFLTQRQLGLEEIADEVKEGEMPLDSYIWMHRDARLAESEKKVIIDWANNVRADMESKYPKDSLIRKK